MHDGLDALEAVLPGHDQPEGGAVLAGQDPAVETERDERERMHGLVEAQPLDVGPIQHASFLLRHLLRVQQRRERHVARACRRLDALQEVGEREADPGDDHRPGLDAAHPIDALLEREPAAELVDIHDLRLGDLSVDGDGPGAGPEGPRPPRRLVLVDAELVEVVVRRHVAIRSLRLRGAEGAAAGDVQP